MQVLVTGSAGAIGRVVVPALRAAGHRVRGFDRVDDPQVDEHHRGELADAAAIGRAVAGVDAVLHLGGTPDQADFVTDLVPHNIVATSRLLESAAAVGVGTVVLASTLRVVAGWRRAQHVGPLGIEVRPRPHDHYSASKVAVEALGEVAARSHGQCVIAARIGWFLRNAQERRRLEEYGARASYLSPGDVARFACAAVACREPGFFPLYVIGPEAADRYDLTAGERVLGWVPREAYPEGAPDWT